MSKPTGAAVAEAARELWMEQHRYQEMDCQAFVRRCVTDAGGNNPVAGVNSMVRKACAWLGTIANARAEGYLMPGALVLIHRDDGGEPAQYRGDGLGNFDHIGVIVGNDLSVRDIDKKGKSRVCDIIHSSASMPLDYNGAAYTDGDTGRVMGSTLANGWTHVMLLDGIDYGTDVQEGVTLDAEALEDGDDAESGGESAEVYAENGLPVKLRAKASTMCKDYELVASGTRVTVHRHGDGWVNITATCLNGRTVTGWMMADFVVSG